MLLCYNGTKTGDEGTNSEQNANLDDKDDSSRQTT